MRTCLTFHNMFVDQCRSNYSRAMDILVPVEEASKYFIMASLLNGTHMSRWRAETVQYWNECEQTLWPLDTMRWGTPKNNSVWKWLRWALTGSQNVKENNFTITEELPAHVGLSRKRDQREFPTCHELVENLFLFKLSSRNRLLQLTYLTCYNAAEVSSLLTVPTGFQRRVRCCSRWVHAQYHLECLRVLRCWCWANWNRLNRVQYTLSHVQDALVARNETVLFVAGSPSASGCKNTAVSFLS